MRLLCLVRPLILFLSVTTQITTSTASADSTCSAPALAPTYSSPPSPVSSQCLESSGDHRWQRSLFSECSNSHAFTGKQCSGSYEKRSCSGNVVDPFVGRIAPTFEAEAVSSDNEFVKIDIKEYRGNKYVLLLFYPSDFTFVCPSELLAFDKEIAEFNKRNVQILGVSIDSKHAHAVWKKMPPEEGGIGNISFPLISDITKNIARSYGVLSADNTVSMRGLFLIDRKGVVQHQLVNNFPIGRNVEEALRVIDALQHTEDHGDVCPANWKLGKPAMVPSREGVKAYFKDKS